MVQTQIIQMHAEGMHWRWLQNQVIEALLGCSKNIVLGLTRWLTQVAVRIPSHQPLQLKLSLHVPYCIRTLTIGLISRGDPWFPWEITVQTPNRALISLILVIRVGTENAQGKILKILRLVLDNISFWITQLVSNLLLFFDPFVFISSLCPSHKSFSNVPEAPKAGLWVKCCHLYKVNLKVPYMHHLP